MATQGAPEVLKGSPRMSKWRQTLSLPNGNPRSQEGPAAEGAALKIDLISLWFQFGFTLSSYQIHFDRNLVSFCFHVGFTLICLAFAFCHIDSTSISRRSTTEKGQTPADTQGKRESSMRQQEKGKRRPHYLRSDSTRQTDRAQARTNERNETRRSPGLA